MWRVGNGSHINALTDCWIPSLFSGKSSMTGSSGLSKVQELISGDRTWNEVELFQCFNKPLSNLLPPCKTYLERTARCAWNLASGEVQSSRDMRWVPPPFGQWRLDVDAGFNDTIGKYSVGAVIRNHCGIIFAASAIGIRRPGSVLEAELSAIHFGLMLAVRGNFSDVWVFSDSCNAVKEVALT
ncbi:uncharacterized protein [Primulina huaijiensis]|uniref:uncharacterized protein n=1 Tax=Primulina huaijiensis TaxID=1492673 RepID=UPI003CC75C5A